MVDYSKEALLERLRQGTVMHDWGGILAVGRAPLNKMLEEQYLARYGSGACLDPVDIRFSLVADGTITAGLRSLILGPPQLSFEHASLTDGVATVRMTLLAGDYDAQSSPTGNAPLLLTASTVRPSMGYYVEALIDLEFKPTETGKLGPIVLDLASGRNFSCNLGDTEYARTMLGKRLGDWFKEQPADRCRYELSVFDLAHYAALGAKRLKVLTQKAPWSSEPGAEGEGAMVVLMQLNTDLAPGSLPTSGSLPYLLPREPDISNTLLRAQYTKPLGEGPSDTLQAVKVSNDRQWDSLEHHEPHDLVAFNTLKAGTLTREIVPAIVSIDAGQALPFSLDGGTGAVKWEASNIFRAAASGAIADGTYSSRAPSLFAQPTQVTRVSGQFESDDQGLQRSALVIENQSSVLVSPRVVTWLEGQTAVDFRASSTGGGQLQWALVGPSLGDLQQGQEGQARFTPAPQTPGRPLIRLQQIEVTDLATQASARACVIIIMHPQSVAVTPHHVLRQNVLAGVQFDLQGNLPSSADIKWTVYGDGDISERSGLYAPPASTDSPCSVVMVEVDNMFAGYAIVEHGQLTPASSTVSSWVELEYFRLEVKGPAKCYANGLQQIIVQVSIKTKPLATGEHYPISDTELDSLRFSLISGSQLKFLEKDEEGIVPPDDPSKPGTWVVNRARNRYYRPTPSAEAGVQAGQGERIETYYVQTTSTLPETLYAEFRRDGGGRISSDDESKENGKVDLEGLPIPNYRIEAYGFNDERKADEGDVVNGDNFNYMDWSVDYWTLALAPDEQQINFVSIEIEADDNKSMVEWESENYEETFASYTGFTLSRTGKMQFDGVLVKMAQARGLVLKDAIEDYSEGTLVVSLNRVSDFPFGDVAEHPQDIEDRTSLQSEFKFMLIDINGNRHKLSVDFGGGQDGRNKLVLSKAK